MPRRIPLALLLASCLVAAGCTGGSSDGGDNSPGASHGSSGQPAAISAVTAMPASPTTVAAGATASDLAIEACQAVFTSAPLVVVAATDDVRGQALAAAAAVHLGVPLLLAPPPAAPPGASTSAAPSTTAEPAATTALATELTRLGAKTVLAVGVGRQLAGLDGLDGLDDVAVVTAPTDAAGFFALIKASPAVGQSVAASGLVAAVAALDPAHPAALTVTDASPPAPGTPGATVAPGELPDVAPATALDGLVVLATADPGSVAAAATARAAGAKVMVTPGPDPRTSSDVITALSAAPPSNVLALGAGFGTAEVLQYRLGVAETGVQLPGGGQVVFPGRRMVALYGNPTTPSLGVLGEQGRDASIARAQQTAAQYDGLFGTDPVIPAFEIIATVASAFAGPDGNYSTEMKIDDPTTPGEDLRAYVDAAREAGVYVMLDLQPGRADFLTQAKLYESLLLEPNVGLALDAEWRLTPTQKPLQVIGTVGIDEVNSVVTWLADLTRDNKLPQKIFMLHQFKLSMIQDRDQLDTSRDELSYLIHADGNGPPGSKFATYAALNASPPPNVRWGWKNFYDEDSPTFTPQETAAVDPQPVFVSYQ